MSSRRNALPAAISPLTPGTRRWPEIEVIDPFDRHPTGAKYDDAAAKATLFAMLDHAAASDLLIAYMPIASMGAALEMYVARQRGVPVVTISPLAENWVVRGLSRRVFLDMEDFMRAVQSVGLPADLG